jgi:NAD-dependent histone deacetylase SIR2
MNPKIRTTQYLDLTSDTAQSEYDRTEALETLLKALRNRRKIVVVAGAGISVSAGIPDFRSSHGLFRSLRGEHKLKSSGKMLFDASVYKDDHSTSSFHDMVRKLSKMSETAQPSAFHRFLARLSVEGRLLRLYTQEGVCLKTSLPLLPLKLWIEDDEGNTKRLEKLPN